MMCKKTPQLTHSLFLFFLFLCTLSVYGQNSIPSPFEPPPPPHPLDSNSKNQMDIKPQTAPSNVTAQSFNYDFSHSSHFTGWVVSNPLLADKLSIKDKKNLFIPMDEKAVWVMRKEKINLKSLTFSAIILKGSRLSWFVQSDLKHSPPLGIGGILREDGLFLWENGKETKINSQICADKKLHTQRIKIEKSQYFWYFDNKEVHHGPVPTGLSKGGEVGFGSNKSEVQLDSISVDIQ